MPVETRAFWTVDTKRPWRQPINVMCEVTIGPRQINLVAVERVGGRMRLRQNRVLFIYGSSAFGTLEAANSRRRYLMREIAASYYHQTHQYDTWWKVKAQLEYERRYS